MKVDLRLELGFISKLLVFMEYGRTAVLKLDQDFGDHLVNENACVDSKASWLI